MSAACLRSSHKAMAHQVPSAFWSLELHISYGRSSHKTCTAAWISHACHRQHMLAEAVSQALQTLTCLSSCHPLAAVPSLHCKFQAAVKLVTTCIAASRVLLQQVQMQQHEHTLYFGYCKQPNNISGTSANSPITDLDQAEHVELSRQGTDLHPSQGCVAALHCCASHAESLQHPCHHLSVHGLRSWLHFPLMQQPPPLPEPPCSSRHP